MSNKTKMDQFGIGAAVRAAASTYFQNARQTGRTNSLVERMKDGDRIVFADIREARRVRLIGLDRGVDVECIVVDPRRPESLLQIKPLKPGGRTRFDNSWVEIWYMLAIERAANGIDYFERHTSNDSEPIYTEPISFDPS